MKNRFRNSAIYQKNPIEYSIGFCKFLNCKIDLSLTPMIPRVETEYWVRKAIEKVKSQKSKIKSLDVLDLFAGSGCIGIAILKHIKNAQLDFADVNKNFLKQIKINLKLNQINPKRYRIIRSDIFQNIKRKPAYDYIFANPPYVALKRKYLVQRSVIDFEPHAAIFAGKDGLFYIRKFLKEAKKHLKIRGRIYLEFDCFQKEELEKILLKFGYKNFKFFKDQYKKWRYAVIKQ